MSGIPIFPCLPNTKRPATEHGFKDATTDLEQIDAWWETADYNLAFCPDTQGWAVLDLDDASGVRTWQNLVETSGQSDETYAVRTPSGGQHLYYVGSLPPTHNRIAPGIDTRGRGSYALLPPSRTTRAAGERADGEYTEIEDCPDPAPLPGWVATASMSRHKPVEGERTNLDQPASLARAKAHLKGLIERGALPEEGSRNAGAFALACDLRDLGLSAEKTLEHLEGWNSYAVEPLEAEELETVVESSGKNRQNSDGVYAVQGTGAETFASAVSGLPVAPRSRYYAEDTYEQDQAEDPTWLIPKLLPDACLALLVGAKGSFKTFLALDIALAISTGLETFGEVPVRSGPVFYAAWEGRNVLKKRRKRAWLTAREAPDPTNFYVMPGPRIAPDDEVQEFGDEITRRCRGQRPALIVVDTLAQTMANSGLDESKTLDGGHLVSFCRSLVETFNCTVLVLHHLGKDEGKGSRGASSIPAGFETIIALDTDRDTNALSVRVKYHKDAAEPDHPWTFEGRDFAGSMVLFPTDREAHKALTEGENEFPPRRINDALVALGAFGESKAVTSTVIATQLIGPYTGGNEDDYRIRINRTARVLGLLARSKLSGYGLKSGKAILWSLPQPQSDPART